MTMETPIHCKLRIYELKQRYIIAHKYYGIIYNPIYP